MKQQKTIPYYTTETHAKWTTDHIDPSWELSHRALNYINRPFNDVETLTEWQKQGHYYAKYTGDMIDIRDGMPQWAIDIGEKIGLKNTGTSLYKMLPGTILPIHRDTYSLYKKVHGLPDDFTDIARAIVFLEGWQSGHYFEIDNTPIINWKAGDIVAWYYDTPHIAANIGSTNRYTLQITGCIK